jgi:septal ring factor EnvC (AmiA/AmiB activator)
MVLYKCDKCLKEFNKKHNYEVHINRKFSCNKSNIDKDFIIEKLTDENIELQNKNEELEDKISKANYKFQQLENENKKINELYITLLDKCFENNKNVSKTNCNNTNTNTNSNNTINNYYNLVPFGMENIDDLTIEEKKTILNSGMFCSVMCAKKLNCNPRLPQYQNISFTNLRSNDAKIY